ncbi:hypothetical protein B0H63DRAFT_305898 [Podospora didyma]|uniref:Uncharacterized protein n=1 Tax=Podospora didyma TaxID=330526 RepID=A0AAE0K5H9_9PEZI|nr:hypothetical protein B0H63DRAFT_305898 [Podospora didyma]
MDHHFSTVLQRPAHFDEDGSNGAAASDDRGPRGGLRDILNPMGSVAASQAAPAPRPSPSLATAIPAIGASSTPPRPHSSFNLRSPTHSSLHHPTLPYGGSPPSSGTGSSQLTGSRSILNNPFMSPSAPSFPPPPQAPATISSPPSASATATGPVVRSPLHAPPVYYSTEIRDRDTPASASKSSFYDPTADSKTAAAANSKAERERELRVSDTSSWRNATQASTPKVSKLWAAPSPH